ncbi:hypothetical protein [Okeania sp. SIO2B3]|uniref:hypothetical protein n=1 Tax=Okeania sp. SIO2B3 TaxID=2607784 RepID=UPI0013C1D913|nr:hypothetical protein [Okeania sp. SIO2B3]NET40440.1 hypothetical protein [Okeania sp. SIO2B3]
MLQENQLTEAFFIAQKQKQNKENEENEVKRLEDELLALKAKYQVPKNVEYSFLHKLLLKLDTKNKLTNSEIKLLKDCNLQETLAIANQIKEFAELKIKYHATKYQDFFPDKLFDILKKIDSAETLSKQEYNWLSNHGLLETLKIYLKQEKEKQQKQREAEAKFAELKDKYQATKYPDKSVSSPLFSILEKLETEIILDNQN